MDFSNLLQVFPNKTKVHPVNMFAVIIYAYSQGKNELLKDFYFFIKKEKRLSQINDKNHQFATAPLFISCISK
ncbi:hypothetical protein RN84_06690 [Fusobacterium nucleatum subsp. nucleatum]|nr:hypothetical protein RN84_06690 [Fusobacterium nucleatum subsp. nucleatum]